MLTSVCFDDQACGRAGEVDDVAANWELAAEFPALQPLGAEELPQAMFGVGLIAAKGARAVA